MQIDITHACDVIQPFVHSFILHEDAKSSLETQNTTQNWKSWSKSHCTYLIILGLLLIIRKQPRFKYEIPHVNEGPANLPPAIPHHPTFIHNLRRHTSNKRDLRQINSSHRSRKMNIRNNQIEYAQSRRLGSSENNPCFHNISKSSSDLIGHRNAENCRGKQSKTQIQTSDMARTRTYKIRNLDSELHTNSLLEI